MLYEKVYNSIIKNSLVYEGCTIICALSGGADSICLADIMFNIKDKLKINVECAHLNHNLRGTESDSDEEFVTRFCKKRGITLHKKSVDVNAIAKGRSIEEAARDARYTFFDELTVGKNAFVATAHTQNDNVETFFINLVRGSGAKGLCGIPIKRQCIIRPMLDVKRDEIIDHLEKHGLDYCIDSTNSDTDYLRNFIRHNIVGKFSERNDIDVFKAVSRAIDNIKQDQTALFDISQKITTYNAFELSKLDDAILFRVLAKRLSDKFDIVLDSVHFESVKSILDKPNGAKTQIKGKLFAKIISDNLDFIEIQPKITDIYELGFGENSIDDRSILINNTKEIYNNLTKATVNYGKIKGNLYVRTRRDGDKFLSAKRKCTSSLKKLLINDKIDLQTRDKLLVVCDDNGIVFVEGYGADKRCIAKKDDKNLICIEIRGSIC